MADPESIRISCSRWEEIVGAVNGAKRALPTEQRKRLGEIFSSYLAGHDLEGAFERMNNRTVSQIFAEYKPVDLEVIASGEVDGVRYRLYEVPPRHGTSEPQPDKRTEKE